MNRITPFSASSVPFIDKEAVGKRLRELRIKFGYSVNDIQNIFDISATAVYKWENGVSLPDIDNLVVLRKLYATPLESILLLDEEEKSSDGEQMLSPRFAA